MLSQLIEFIRDKYQTNDFIPLHAPTFMGNEKAYVLETIESTFVSSVGAYVDLFEKKIEEFTGCAKAVATVNGTSALHTALYLSGVQSNDLVITQALTFVATCNAIHHMGAEPVFVDISKQSLGMSPSALEAWLYENAVTHESGFGCVEKRTGRRIQAVVPMHTFGHPVELDELQQVCSTWGIALIEDAAESLGSYYKGHHTGTIAPFSALSFNGNKIITTGGGGMVLCKTVETGLHAKHVTTTAKRPHPFEFYHDEPGFNYRLPNLNAALGCAQIEMLEKFLVQKRSLAESYEEFFRKSEYQFIKEPKYAKSNYWLNAVLCDDIESRNELLRFTNNSGVMTRPVWTLMHRLPTYQHCMRGCLTNSEWAEARLVNLPSSARSFY